ncbi:CobB/CobQ-like glutamine amidotransferase domain-containing protein [Entophlyctis helioformis]|nr:CobB/CobQ-like glutamine amidotransferase domain-containing protein [Entophlyctis helioformis]
MLVLPGSHSLSAFRRSLLLADFAAAVAAIDGPAPSDVRAFNPGVAAVDRSSLDLLLAYGPAEANSFSPIDAALRDAIAARKPLPAGWHLLFVATDIARICGLGDQVARLERAVAFCVHLDSPANGAAILAAITPLVHDRMTHTTVVFETGSPRPLKAVDIAASGSKVSGQTPRDVLVRANTDWGLALADDEIDYLIDAFLSPSEPGLMMFAQVNSEHCRHKIFRATWTIDGAHRETSLFAMIRNTYEKGPEHILSAYSDNAAVLAGPVAARFAFNPATKVWEAASEAIHTLIKVETHNHPTAVSPFPGAATGSGGEIRDEAAVGQGSRTKAGLTGFTVSNLCIPGFEQPWEAETPGRPAHIASPFDIMIQAPLGGAAFNNEFGRPGLTGYFRTYLDKVPTAEGGPLEWRGYHKPIMIAGGMGTVRPMHILKRPITPGSAIIVLGGPAMLIGLGGGAASSMASGQSSADLDFASVQRENPEMQRRAQLVIDTCNAMGENTPITAIHDVGAGGLSNALPELVNDSGLGAVFQLRNVPCDDPRMSPMEIWCNESQERYVLAVAPEALETFKAICQRERAPYAVVGTATAEKRLLLVDSLLGTTPIDLPMSTLFGKAPKMHRVAETLVPVRPPLDTGSATLTEMVDRVLALPAVAAKGFLITIGDRSVTGLVARDQLVGPWQTPVADAAVILSSYEPTEYAGQAMAMGERTPLALVSAGASARMAVGESLTNLASAHVPDLGTVRLSANWMSAASHPGEGAALYEAVQAVGMDLCPALGLTIPVGKDSMSMKSKWAERAVGGAGEKEQSVTAPMSLIVTAYGTVADARFTLTPTLRSDVDDTLLVFLDASGGHQRMGGSAIAQVYNQVGSEAPDVDAALLKAFWALVQGARGADGSEPVILAYHDRSDGGLFATVAEMCFAGRVGARLELGGYVRGGKVRDALFNEELGAVVQHVHVIGEVTPGVQELVVAVGGIVVLDASRVTLQRKWQETSFRMQERRDNPASARAEYDSLLDTTDAGVHAALTYDAQAIPPAVSLVTEGRPRVVVLREQGVNSHAELAAAFHWAGFEAVDVHMTDLIAGTVDLSTFVGLACRRSILLNGNARKAMEGWFQRADTFTIGVCNGCQMVTGLARSMNVPGTAGWPTFVRNVSEQFEARVAMVRVSPATAASERGRVFFKGMGGSRIPIAVAHGEGRAEFHADAGAAGVAVGARGRDPLEYAVSSGMAALQYVDGNGTVAGPERYPYNPNGSPLGIAGVTSDDGRVLALMPHPERVIRGVTNTWSTGGRDTGVYSGWMRLFWNARSWVEANRS